MKLKLFPNLELPAFTAPLFLCLAIAATALVMFESLVPTGPSLSVNHFDKVMHFLSYGILTGLWGVALQMRRLPSLVLWIVGLGVGLEIAQHLMEFGRTGSVWDSLANAGGAIAAVFILQALCLRVDETPNRTVA